MHADRRSNHPGAVAQDLGARSPVCRIVNVTMPTLPSAVDTHNPGHLVATSVAAPPPVGKRHLGCPPRLPDPTRAESLWMLLTESYL